MIGNKKLRFVLFLLAAITTSHIVQAQIGYFVYFQSEGNQPFYATLNKKNHSSSSIGHLILPSLENGTYDITIGFPNDNKKQEYQITINDKDLGFLIKKVDGDEKFGLLNLQTAAVQIAGAQKQQAEAEKQKAAEAEALAAKQAETAKQLELQQAAEQKEREAEAARKAEEALAMQAKTEAEKKATETTTQTQTEIIKTETAVKVDTEAEAAANLKRKQEEEVRKYNEERRAILLKEEAAQKEAEAKKAQEAVKNNTENTGTDKPLSPAEIARLMEEARKIDAKGKRDSVLKAMEEKKKPAEKPMFLDFEVDMPRDTISSVSTQFIDSTTAIKTGGGAAPTDTVWVTGPEAIYLPDTANDVAIDTISTEIKNNTKDTVSKKSNAANLENAVPSLNIIKSVADTAYTSAQNPNCLAAATDADIDLIAMLIKDEKDSDEAIDLVKKMVKLKCVSTSQIRKLGNLLTGDEARYGLLDLCYKYTQDQQQYFVLANLLQDAYYINRFKAMLQ